jgi:serine/threonine-protein kinase
MANANRDLLFGLLALQNGMIDQSKLVAAFQAWTLEKTRPLAEHLVCCGDLEPDQRAIIDAMVGLHLKKHGGSTEKSLAAIPAGSATRQSLHRITDPELGASLAILGPAGEVKLDGLRSQVTEVTAAFPHMSLAETDPGQELPILGNGEDLLGGSAGRYQLLGEIARGGMGAVLKGRDPDLGRDLALKVLLDQHRDRADLINRFVEEAQICGQLQHPGVVPVYELGTLADRRPFFSMKLVKGQTLAALLAQRSSPSDDLPRFLAIFEAVCQTVAYAHARGVIHRDLKPSNVMVGSFGEVQVMDWGLAKVLPRDTEQKREAPRSARNETIVATSRTKGDSDLSQAGSVLGTPAYMAPEQARGQTESIGRQADVFSLGAILCEILTGMPVFSGETAVAILRAAERADTSAAIDRLAGCEADEELLALARDCLAATPGERPADAGVVAGRLTRYLAGVQERLRTAELARAAQAARAEEAEAKAFAERRARSLTRAMAATVLLAGGLAAASWRWFELERLASAREATAKVNAAVHEATRLRGQAQSATVGDLAPWDAAVAAAERASDLLVTGVEPPARKHAEDLVVEVVAERARAEAASLAAKRERQLLDHLVDIRSARFDDSSGIGTDAAYTTAFRGAAIDPDALPPDQAAERIKARPPATAIAIAMALDDWAAVRRDLRFDGPGAKRLETAARLADPDPWRNKLRDAGEISDKAARRAVLSVLAASIKDQPFPPVSFDLVGRALGNVNAKVEAESILRKGRRLYPDDLWLNYDLASALEAIGRTEEAIRYYTAARLLRPESAHELAHALAKKGEKDDAISVFRDLVRIRPRNGRHLSCFGRLLQNLGANEEARGVLTRAEGVLREAVAARPNDYRAFLNLGNALDNLGRLEEAIAMFRKALEIKPDYFTALENLGSTLYSKREYAEAMVYFREALRLQPDNGYVHAKLGALLDEKGLWKEALIEREVAARLNPDDPDYQYGLAQALRRLGRFDATEAAFRKALDLDPNHAYSLNSLAWDLSVVPDRRKRRPQEALELILHAIREAPNVSTYYNTLGLAEYRNGLWNEAIATLTKSVEMSKGSDPTDFFFLAMAHWVRGEKSEADQFYRRAVEAAAKDAASRWEWRMIWAEAAELLGKPGPVPTLFEVQAQPDHAIDTLRRMAASGFLQPETLRTSPDLAPLRGRRDFQLLAMDLAMPAQPFAQNR